MREIIRSHEISTSWSFGPVPVFNWRFQTGQLCSLQFRFNRVFRCVDSPAFSHALKVIALIFETCITKIQGSPQRLKYLGIVSEFRRFIVTGRNFISLIACRCCASGAIMYDEIQKGHRRWRKMEVQR
jgi:hypothetical protein